MKETEGLTKRSPLPGSIKFVDSKTGRPAIIQQQQQHRYVSVPIINKTQRNSSADIESNQDISQGMLAISGDAVNEINFGGIARAAVACCILGICIIVIFLIVVSIEAAQKADTS